MRISELVKYYSQKDFIELLLKFGEGRELVPRFGNAFGLRPQVFNYNSDVLNVIRRGATSFHFSEERWVNPMRLSPELKQKELDELRSGWDLVFDIDCADFKLSTTCAKLLVDAIDLHDVKASVKFSGNTGWHIGVPFESFPERINNKPVKDLFPEAPRVISAYLADLIKDYLRDLIKPDDKNYNPYDELSIDSIAISSRHLLRLPFSLNEKSWLVSLPVKPKDILSFKREEAAPEKIVFNDDFLKNKSDATALFTKAFDWFIKDEKKTIKKNNYSEVIDAVESKFFPPCVNNILKGLSDGRKRGLFILINFLSKTGYSEDLITKTINDWNERNTDPLSRSYVNAQLSWSFKHGSKLPPNCDKQAFYTDIRVCKPDNLCKRIKNPVTYSLRKSTKLKDKKDNGVEP